MRCWSVVGLFLWEHVQIIGLKYLGNSLNQCGSNKMSVLLCEGPKPNISMISGFVSPGEPLFMSYGLKYTKILQKYKESLEKFPNICFL